LVENGFNPAKKALRAEKNKAGIIGELHFRRENPLCSRRRGAKALTNIRRLKRKVDLK
jgi:hypothetical protein